MQTKVLVANRGEIACRVLRTLRRLGTPTVAVYSDADRDAPHVALADEAHHLGAAPVTESYLNQARLLEVLRETGATAVHPGYGLLSENASFAEGCEAQGVAFIGPTPQQIREFGLKHTAREQAVAAEVPLVPGTDLLDNADDAAAEAQRIGYPVMLKSTAGGGGIGMRRCDDEASLREAFESVVRQGQASFGDGSVFLEKFLVRARHVEVQIFGDGKGRVLALGERDCSAQRRNQKVIEETPAPNLPDATREALQEAAVRLASAVNYRSAGTVEFVLDAESGEFYFLEVNTRLQVEHTVTEEVTGLDLVEWMVKLATDPAWVLPETSPPRNGWAMQARLYAEDPNKDFQPSSGVLTHARFPTDARCDGWVESGTEVSPFYDPLLSKIIVHGEDREDALQKLSAALAAIELGGIETNLGYLQQILEGELFRSGDMTTRALADFAYLPATVDVLAPGAMTTIQDHPGRLGYWEVGVPPSGAMDPLALRLANRLLENATDAAGLEITATGPTLHFNCATRIALTGAEMPAKLDGEPLPFWESIPVHPGQTLKMGTAAGPGNRAYLAIDGGFQTPPYLGSRSTFTLGQFGGHAGRALQIGDVLPITPIEDSAHEPCSLAAEYRPCYQRHWQIAVLYGPHGAPEFFTPEDTEMFFSTDWEVHYNSARTGVRLIGPKPTWARPDGGEAGLHPSNIHDNAYGIGSVDFTGDMPILLGPDGPSLGGFVCPAAVIGADLWKLGQLRPGDTLRFCHVTEAEAKTLTEEQETLIETLQMAPAPAVLETRPAPSEPSILKTRPATGQCPEIVFRPSGDRYLLVEFGPLALEIHLRFWVHAIYSALQADRSSAIIDLTPGIRSLQIHFNARELNWAKVIDWVEGTLEKLPDVQSLSVPSRIVHLPLSWDDPSTREAIEKYMQSVNPDAPWCPSNIEFIRRINGLSDLEEVKRIVFDSSYLVLGLGDVYLGAPVATPLDPRHRLVTTKYNPARTWTPENAVGIGGAYLCVYGMEGPGGYQFVGRTLQMWNRYRSTDCFEDGKPWLLRFFDQVRFYPVSGEELKEIRRAFPQGRYPLRIEEGTFSLSDYQAFLDREADSIAAFRETQRSAFAEERARWEAAGINVTTPTESDSGPELSDAEVPEGHEAVLCPVNGSLWKLLIEEGQTVEEGETVALVEAMKMEFPVAAPCSGTVSGLYIQEGQIVTPGQTLIAIEPC